MLPTITNALRNPVRLLPVVPVGLVLLLVALPTYAANPVAKGAQPPNATCPAGGQCFADVLPANPFYEFANRLYQQDIVTGYACGGAGEPCDAENRPYYRPGNAVTRQQMSKFVDQARRMPGIFIDTGTDSAPLRSFTSASNGVAVFGKSTSGSNSDTGVLGESTNGAGVFGRSTSGGGVVGESASDAGVWGESASGIGLYGYSGSGYGVYAFSSSSWAGYFSGNINVTGNCTGCAGPTRIDHPLDPGNKYLYHSTVQSPDMKNVYDGNVTLDARGEGVVTLPDYFEALNRDFRYQLTPMGAPGPNLYVAEKIKNNRFKIAGGSPGMEVSWQVTGIRHDPYAQAHRVSVEEEKRAEERGKYLHPTEWGQPESLGADYAERQKMDEAMQR